MLFLFPGQARLGRDCRNTLAVITAVMGDDQFSNPILLPAQPDPAQPDAALVDLFNGPLAMCRIRIFIQPAQIVQ